MGGPRGSSSAAPVDFVLGTGRCGSTLVHEVLCQHPDVAFLSNLEDRSRRMARTAALNGPLYRRLPLSTSHKGRLRFAPSEGYVALAREVSPLLANSDRDLRARDATPWLARRFDDFFASRAQAQAAPQFLHKFTGWPRARFIHAVMPDARFVHVVRDGRAVANSWLQMPWWLGHRGPEHWHFGPLPSRYQQEWEESGRSYVTLAGLAWKVLIDAADEARAALPPECWLEVRYEDVLRRPDQTLRQITTFLGLPSSDAFDERVARYDFSTGRATAYRRDLGADAVAELDGLLGPHLERFGYEL